MLTYIVRKAGVGRAGNAAWWIQPTHCNCRARETLPLKKVQSDLSSFGRGKGERTKKMRTKRRKSVIGNPQHHYCRLAR